MGTEALWIPAVLSAVGAGVQAKETDDTARRTDEVAAQGIRSQATRQQQADARVSQEVNKLQGSTPEDATKQATDAFMEQLLRTRGQSRGPAQVGATSDAFNTDSAGAATDVANYGANRASLLGRINAPGIQRTNENVSRSRAGTDLGLIGRAANSDQFLTQLRLQNTRPNPWTMAGGEIIGGIGSGMAGSGAYSETPNGLSEAGVGRVIKGGKPAWGSVGVGGGFGGGMNA